MKHREPSGSYQEEERNKSKIRNTSNKRNIARKTKRIKMHVHVEIINKGTNKQ